jgi:hypothetical protein
MNQASLDSECVLSVAVPRAAVFTIALLKKVQPEGNLGHRHST